MIPATDKSMCLPNRRQLVRRYVLAVVGRIVVIERLSSVEVLRFLRLQGSRNALRRGRFHYPRLLKPHADSHHLFAEAINLRGVERDGLSGPVVGVVTAENLANGFPVGFVQDQ